MSHYKSNLRDIEFNLYEVLEIQDHLGSGEWADLDRETVDDILTEIERIATEDFAASYADQDRIPLELIDGEVTIPDSVKKSVSAFKDGGWNRLGLAEEMGGTPAPPTVMWAMSEMLFAANTTVQFYAGGGLFARVLFEEGTEEQKEFAKLWIERDWGGSMILTEPDAGSDVGAGTTKAVDQGDGTWHIEGVKRFITGGEQDVNENIIHLVLARPEGAGPGTKGLSLFVVPKYLVGDDGSLGPRNGVYATNLEKKMGLKGSTTCEMTFGMDDPAVGYLVGDKHDGIRQMFRVVESARMMIGTKAMGTLSTGYLNALEYAQERVQGADLTEAADKTAPKVPIIRHPNVRRMLMKQKAYAEGLRALVFYTAWVQDQIQLHPDDDHWKRRNDLLLPIVKGYSSEKAYELLATSMQVFGGSGYTQDYPIEQYIRDAKIDTIYEGTTGIQALDLFFRKIARDQGSALASLAGEIVAFIKGGTDDDPLAIEREKLGTILDDAQTQLGSMVEHLMASLAGDKEEIYKVGLQTDALLESLAEVVIAWQMLRHAEIAIEKVDEDPFYRGKVESARWLLNDVAPKVAARRDAAAAEDGSLMDLPVEAF
ncbi:MAG: acyl-CoA dehydrogenase [Acidobacteria bacterium]|nr:MAG: acyl-CoA dehydrogenase [Acidobacteriota bacterium]